MDVHGSLHDRIGGLGIHEVQDTVDNLITASPQNGGAENALRLRINEDFHESPCIALLHCSRDVRHGHLANEHALAGFERFRLCYACPPERWIDIERIGRYAIAYSAWILLEKVGCDDLEIIVGGVGEGALAVAVAHGPDSRDICAQLIVDADIAVLVMGYSCRIETEIVRVGPSARGDQ